MRELRSIALSIPQCPMVSRVLGPGGQLRSDIGPELPLSPAPKATTPMSSCFSWRWRRNRSWIGGRTALRCRGFRGRADDWGGFSGECGCGLSNSCRCGGDLPVLERLGCADRGRNLPIGSDLGGGCSGVQRRDPRLGRLYWGQWWQRRWRRQECCACRRSGGERFGSRSCRGNLGSGLRGSCPQLAGR